MTDEILIVNENNIIGKHKTDNEQYEYVKYEITPRHDFNQCYVAIYEIPPQKSNYPYHYHIANTEAFYVISGQGIMKTPRGDKKSNQGILLFVLRQRWQHIRL